MPASNRRSTARRAARALSWRRLATLWASTAVALDITFDDVISVGNPVVTMRETQGYRFTGAFRTRLRPPRRGS